MNDLRDQLFVITGANTGIGRVTAETLADRGADVVLASRSKERTQDVIDTISQKHGEERVTFVPLDLGSFDSVRAASDTILALDRPIQCLINNAGLASTGATADGFELNFGINHLGHFLLTLPLVERLKEADNARIVHVASKAHYVTKEVDWDAMEKPTASRTGYAEYSVSKLANVLFSNELARRLEGTGVKSYSLHPGVIASDIWRVVPAPLRWPLKFFMISVEEGAQTSLHCATSDEVSEESGLYYDESKPRKPSKLARDEDLAAELWRRSEAWTGAEWAY